MDWTPQTDHEARLYQDVGRIRRQFVRELGPEQAVHGVGVVAAEGQSSLLVLVDRRFAETSEVFSARRGWREQVRPVPAEALPEAREVLGPYELPDDSWILPVSRPQPLGIAPFSTGDPLRGAATGMRGTAGVRVRLPDGSTRRPIALLTAGHVAGTVPGAVVERIRHRPFTRKLTFEPLGEVVCGYDPVEQPGRAGYDLAVVRCAASPLMRLRSTTTRQLPAFISVPEPAVLVGALSGEVHGALIGALCAYGDHVRLWRNTWTMIPSQMAVQGDSGAPVLGSDGRLVGMLVGGSAWPYSTAMEVQYVQDADAARREILDQMDITLV